MNCINILLQDDILSRKISIQSMTRHFTGWKKRKFVLSGENGTLLIHTQGKNDLEDTLIYLQSPSVSFGRHHYSKDGYQWLWIKYIEINDHHLLREIILKFSQEHEIEQWMQGLNNITQYYQNLLDIESKKFSFLLNDFLLEQFTLQSIAKQVILSSEDIEGDGVYFANEIDESDLEKDEEDEMIPINDGYDTDLSVEPVQNLISSSDGVSRVYSSSLIPKPSLAIHHTPPPMHILILAVGTRGDIEPFVHLAHRLQSDGHFLRIASHDCFRDFILSQNIDFYPLAGDPRVLSEFMVKSQGFLIPTSADALLEAPKFRQMIVEIIHSCWDACMKTDPKAKDCENLKPFAPDLIISNPVTYAHIHISEALGIPLHLMFPQPWVPTKAFPHPLSCLSYEKGWCTENFLSYQVVDNTLWLTFELEINNFRVNTLGLEPIRVGQVGWNMLNYHRIPFVKMWSPSLVPKPKDWPDYIDVVGAFFDPKSTVTPKNQSKGTIPLAAVKGVHIPSTPSASVLPVPSSEQYKPPADLIAFLDDSSPILFVGFGSMVNADLDNVFGLFLEAAAIKGVKIILQTGWSVISTERFEELVKKAKYNAWIFHSAETPKVSKDSSKGNLSSWEEEEDIYEKWDRKDVLFLGPCPHDWLFQRVTAVIHHGGAGTTSCGLRHGCPTWICPFFGDQHFWGEMIFRSGLGPKPCPVYKINCDLIQINLDILLSESSRQQSLAFSVTMNQENGVESAVSALYRHLPLENMLCDISLVLNQSYVLADVYCPTCRLKMCSTISSSIHTNFSDHSPIPYCYEDWSTDMFHATTTQRVVQGLGAYVHELAEGMVAAVYDPVNGIYRNGVTGGATGLLSGLQSLVSHQLSGGRALFEKLSEGVKGSISGDLNNSLDEVLLNQECSQNRNGQISFSCSPLTLTLRKQRIDILSNLRLNTKHRKTDNPIVQEGLNKPITNDPLDSDNNSDNNNNSQILYQSRIISGNSLAVSSMSQDSLTKSQLNLSTHRLPLLNPEELSYCQNDNDDDDQDLLLSKQLLPLHTPTATPLSNASLGLIGLFHPLSISNSNLASVNVGSKPDTIQSSTINDKSTNFDLNSSSNDESSSVISEELDTIPLLSSMIASTLLLNNSGDISVSSTSESDIEKHHSEILLNSYQFTQTCLNIFDRLGANGKRGISESSFLKLMNVVLSRATSLNLCHENDHITSKDDEIRLQFSLQNFFKILSKKKKYLDFSDFLILIAPSIQKIQSLKPTN